MTDLTNLVQSHPLSGVVVTVLVHGAAWVATLLVALVLVSTSFGHDHYASQTHLLNEYSLTRDTALGPDSSHRRGRAADRHNTCEGIDRRDPECAAAGCRRHGRWSSGDPGAQTLTETGGIDHDTPQPESRQNGSRVR